MITLNNSIFYDKKEKSDGKNFGFYTRRERSIVLFNIDKEKIGVINKFGIILSARKLEDGKWWYTFAKPEGMKNYNSYQREKEEVKNLAIKSSFDYNTGETVFWFK